MSPSPLPSLRRTLTTPGWRRSLLLRRVAAALLVLLALALTVREATGQDPSAVVFARDVPAGAAVTADDVSSVRVPPHLLPADALTDPGEVEGRVVTAAAQSGEIATKHRFIEIGPAGTDVSGITHLVPVRLAEPEVIPLLHHGDTVDVVTHAPDSGLPETIAAGAKVILASAQDTPGTLLVALPADDARAVAAASLGSPLAVVITGDRASGG